MIFSCPKGAFPEQYTPTVEVESYNFDGELVVIVNEEEKFLGPIETPPVFYVKQGDKIAVAETYGNGAAYVRQFSGLIDVQSSDNFVEGTVAGNVHIIVSADPPRTR